MADIIEFQVGDRFRYVNPLVTKQDMTIWVVDRIDEGGNIYIYDSEKDPSSVFNWTSRETGIEKIKKGEIDFLFTRASRSSSDIQVGDLLVDTNTGRLIYVYGIDDSTKEYYIKINRGTTGDISDTTFQMNVALLKIRNGEIINLKELRVGDEFIRKDHNTSIIITGIDGIEVKYDMIDLDTANKIREHSGIDDRVKYKLINDGYEFQRRLGDFAEENKPQVVTENQPVTAQTDVVDDTPFDIKGDFVAEFLNRNAIALSELEKKNKPLLNLVEDTLNFLNKRFGTGKTVVDTLNENIEEIKVEVEEIQEQPEKTLIDVTELEIIWTEGSTGIRNKKFKTWREINDAFKEIYDDWAKDPVGYNKVKIKITWEDGSYIVDRIDVGDSTKGDYNPYEQTVGSFIDGDVMYNKVLKKDINEYQWEDYELIESVNQEATELTKEELEIQIQALESSLAFLPEEEKEATQQEIDTLKTTLKFL